MEERNIILTPFLDKDMVNFFFLKSIKKLKKIILLFIKK